MFPEDFNRREESFSSFREERLERRRKRPAILIGIFTGIFIALAVGWLTLGKYVSIYYGADSEELPLIKADSSVDGIRPTSPGGMNVPDQDKMVYERLRQGNSTDLPVERLLPPPEKPKKPIVAEAVVDGNDAIGDLAGQILAEEQVTSTATAVIYEQDGTPVEVVFREKDKVKIVVAEVPSQKEELKQAKVKVEEKTEKEVAYMVQLVSTRSLESAEAEWKRLSKKFNEIMKDLPYTVSKMSSDKGAFYRLRVGQFKTRDEAVALCDKFKVNKQECFVVK